MALHFTRTMDNSKKLKVRILYTKYDRAKNNFSKKLISVLCIFLNVHDMKFNYRQYCFGLHQCSAKYKDGLS